MSMLSRVLLNVSVFAMLPVFANAAGTYYTGNYQSPQTRYAQRSYSAQRANNANYSQQGISAYSRGQYTNAGYQPVSAQKNVTSKTENTSQNSAGESDRNGLYLNAGLARQSAMWQFEMKTAGSKLHYDNIDWNVFNLDGGYVFDIGNTKMQINAGLQYGGQAGESSMIDDDISHGGYLYDCFVDVNDNVYNLIGHAISIGTSKGGDMFGFNAGLGMTDFFKWGKVKFTPSIGWRYLKYNLETSNNHGNVVVNGDFDDSCIELEDGSVECLPLIGAFDANSYLESDYPGYQYVDVDGDSLPDFVGAYVSGYDYVDATGSFYFYQPDVSHSYEVEWSGPYLALDVLYEINKNNSFDARVEVGLPAYTATGDQPYRFDWQHPKSVQDKGGMGDAIHFGFGANWSTAITDSVAFSLGLTYDYYSVSGVDATTFYNSEYWQGLYNDILALWVDKFGATDAEQYMLNGVDVGGQYYAPDETALMIDGIRADGWKVTTKSEIESFYKSLGIRAGIKIKF